MNNHNEFINESEYWKNIHQNDWTILPIDKNLYYEIIVFDESNENFRNYKNKWYIYAEKKDKIALVNAYNFNIYIGSIYIWMTKINLSK